MQIIPVIDVLKGQVVLAQGGRRVDYPLLASVLTKATEPAAVIEDLLVFYAFKTLYIADLDSIEGAPLNRQFYQDLAQKFPDLQIWLDAGIRKAQHLKKSPPAVNIRWVAGSETLPCVYAAAELDNWILSLDFRDDQLLGDDRWLVDKAVWPAQVIVMDLDAVGRHSGPGYLRLESLTTKHPQQQWIASGGIRNAQDLQKLAAMGITSVLLASALHKGNISAKQLAALAANNA
ncbi:MAG: HisA/HisF-related TIM barrel protein [Methylophaga sp.]|nr:HisA/HisF-related TIM barrel protein [Methylophaga sp.]